MSCRRIFFPGANSLDKELSPEVVLLILDMRLHIRSGMELETLMLDRGVKGDLMI
jgi:FixJ family two-component response regulator